MSEIINLTKNSISNCNLRQHAIFCKYICAQARQTRPNSGGVAEGHLRFDKVVAIIFYFLRVKNRTFQSFYAKRPTFKNFTL